jgi:hypothetical protein
MDMATISVTEDEAKAALEQYRTAMRESAQKEVRELTSRARERRRAIELQDKAIVKGYELIAKHKTVIMLRQTLVNGGEDEHHRPRLAVARADERSVDMTRYTSGRVDFMGSNDWRDKDYAEKPWNSNRDYSFMELLPPVDAKELGVSPSWNRLEATAILPHIPPGLRPDALERYHVLWEADWQRKQPIDPALLRHLRGDLYAVIATWDLTELERAVLDG